ncbi:hypothetical protein SAMN05216359_10898 [Roseateles sp. YR242]|uniref:hypothetical protein n=1 Tax=Roseateles sp. YR242 TaxID=1855305 RepID=UPI0008D0E552|nr:hypothetical protein [Roseateles sp. YR242]SEL37861.1 hypothetical protein SAMN05216359_10898 [Roseateles sp. YR242]
MMLPHPSTLPLAAPRPAEEQALGFEGLRAEGLRWLQALSGQRWTDHNLHDPGITLLEQLCFGLTDLVYRNGFPVADHLAGPGNVVDYDALSLHPPAAVFPCRATTPEDYRRWLLDRVPGLDDATLTLVQGQPGVYQLRLKPSEWLAGDDEADDADGGDGGGQAEDDAVTARREAARVAEARKAWHTQRNLGEDLAPRVTCEKDVMCDLKAVLEIEGERDAVHILADVYDRCARFIAGAPVSDTLHDRLGSALPLADIYDGPAMQHGFIRSSSLAANDIGRLFLSDVAAEMRQVPGVFDARVVSITPDVMAPQDLASAGHGTVVGSVAWHGDGWALALRLPSPRSPAWVEVRRRGHLVHIPPLELRRRLNDLQTAGRARRSRQQADQASRADALLPRGVHRDLGSYYSVQHHLPAIYGLGRYGVPSSAPPQVHARVKQLKAYMVLHEQLIAQGLAQLQAMRSLFAIDRGSRQTLWTQPIGEDQVPGLQALYLSDPAAIAQSQLQRLDSGTARKRRALDHLLALHGETYTQNSMRQFCTHLLHDELESLLLENKAAWLRDIVTLTRDRAAGVDLGRPSWGQTDNCSGLQRRASLLLGFRLWHDRPLTRVLRDHRVMIDAGTGSAADGADTPPATVTSGAPGLVQLPPEFSERGTAAGTAVRPTTRTQVQEDLSQFPWLRRQPLPVSLTRTAARAQRYRVMPPGSIPMLPQPTIHLHDPAPDSPELMAEPTPHATLFALPKPDTSAGYQLVLGPDEEQRWWVLGGFKDEDAARRAASSLRLFMLHLDQESEGLHVIEHVLLRPLRDRSPEHEALKLAPGFHQLKVTAVLPGWTSRTAQPAFRNFAAETLRISTPAHLALRLRWLDLPAMQRFEELHEQWLDTRLGLAGAADDPRALARTDRAAVRLLALMLEWQEADRVNPAGNAHV